MVNYMSLAVEHLIEKHGVSPPESEAGVAAPTSVLRYPRSMKDSESAPNESVEQHSDQSRWPAAQSCRTAAWSASPERIAAHDCRPNRTANSPSHEHTDTTTLSTDHPTSGPALKLNTTIVRQREADHTTGRLEITRTATAGPLTSG